MKGWERLTPHTLVIMFVWPQYVDISAEGKLAGATAVPETFTDSSCYIYKVEFYESEIAQKEGIGHLYMVTDRKTGTKWSDKNPLYYCQLDKEINTILFFGALFLTLNPFLYIHKFVAQF